jgi:hypothetical protein
MRSLDKKAKAIVMEQMADLKEITREEVEALIEPHYCFNPVAAKEREIRRRANQLMTQFRDEHGIRTCYNYKNINGQSMYVNVDETKDPIALNRVKLQLDTKFNGLSKAQKKVKRRQSELDIRRNCSAKKAKRAR